MVEKIIPKEYEVKLSEVKELSPAIKLFTLEFEEKFYFNPGQYIILERRDDGGNIIRRSYSISSYPGSKFVDLCMNIIPQGKMTSYLNALKRGDKIKVFGPYGKFGDGIERSERDILFIAAGTGITPIKCLIDHLIKSKFSAKFDLLYGFREEQNYLFKEEISFFLKKSKNFSVKLAASRPLNSKKWLEEGNFFGRVTNYLEDHLSLEEIDKEFYICGLSQMVRDTKELLLKKGVDPRKIHIEPW